MFIFQCKHKQQKRSSLTGFLGCVQVSEIGCVLFTTDTRSDSPQITVQPLLLHPHSLTRPQSEAMTLTVTVLTELHVCESICSQSWLGSLALSPLPHSGHVSLFTITNDHIGPLPSALSPRPGHCCNCVPHTRSLSAPPGVSPSLNVVNISNYI